MGDNNNSRGDSPIPDQFFTGHQEFFYLFITSNDSYKFSSHLKKRLKWFILTLNSKEEDRTSVEHVSKMQLLAKFLGMLEFSPNWYLNPEAEKINSVSSYSKALQEVELPLPIFELVEEGWGNKKLFTLIPWILSFLQMMMWDKISLRAPYFSKTFSLLRTIQKKIVSSTWLGDKSYESELLVLVHSLEDFFLEVVGLREAEQLDLQKLRTDDKETSGECSHVATYRISQPFLLSSCHVEDLRILIGDLALDHKGKACGASKKLKPYLLSVQPSKEVGGSNIQRKHFALLDPLDEGKLQGLSRSVESASYQMDGHESKLVDAFFHQHKQIQKLCEFLVECSVQNLSATIVQEFIIPAVHDSFKQNQEVQRRVTQPVNLDWYLSSLQGIENDAIQIVKRKVEQKCDQYILNGMELLTPPTTNDEVRNIATSLSLKHAHRKVELLISSLIRVEAKKEIDGHISRSLDASKKDERSGINKTEKVEIDEQTRLVSQMLSKLTQDINIYLSNTELNGDVHHPLSETTRAGMTEILKMLKNPSLGLKLEMKVTNTLGKALVKLFSYWFNPSKDFSTYPLGFSESISIVSFLVDKAGALNGGVENHLDCLMSNSMNMKRMISWTVCPTSDSQKEKDVNEWLNSLLLSSLIKSKDEVLCSILNLEGLSQKVAIKCLELYGRYQ